MSRWTWHRTGSKNDDIRLALAESYFPGLLIKEDRRSQNSTSSSQRSRTLNNPDHLRERIRHCSSLRSPILWYTRCCNSWTRNHTQLRLRSRRLAQRALVSCNPFHDPLRLLAVQFKLFLLARVRLYDDSVFQIKRHKLPCPGKLPQAQHSHLMFSSPCFAKGVEWFSAFK